MLKREPVQNPLFTELFNAVQAGNCKKVRYMIKTKKDRININAKDQNDPYKRTALLYAAEDNNHEMCCILLRAKPNVPDVNAEDESGNRPIIWAAKHKSAELAEVLLESGKCDVNYLDRNSGCTPLYTAIMSNHAPLCRVLVHAGADVNLRQLGVVDPVGETPLIKAIQLNNIEICDMLMNSLCNIKAQTNDGLTALHYAVAYRRYDIVELLLESKITMYAKSHHGVTALSVAIDHHLPLMVKILIEFGYKISRRYAWGETPLDQAINLHSEECAMTLVHWGCPIVQKAKNKPSYFYSAANEGMLNLVRLLISMNPLFLNEEWVQKQNIMLALYKKPSFCQWLDETRRQPRRLGDWCRARIWKYLGKNGPYKVKQLSLPAKIIDFLSFSEYFHDRMYDKKTLDIAECPFDCPVTCLRKQCPPIDILPSDDTE
ncbi:ankyrin repeat domain-containing protein 29-like [Lineus longissimus]|uniref:ankyrin repeat domain-containing protein 29-like n=1 Tax=Lineus longissimus TaxID=88925 RepID=UPI00315D09DB